MNSQQILKQTSEPSMRKAIRDKNWEELNQMVRCLQHKGLQKWVLAKMTYQIFKECEK